jgi:formate dehydrogenase subunit beta
MNTILPVEDGDVLTAIRSFLKRLLDTKVIETLYVPLETNDKLIVPTLVADTNCLSQANPLTPLMPINSARAMSAITGLNAPARLGAVLRSCEIRALIELVKLHQTTLEDVILIGLDCLGTYDVNAYKEALHDGRFEFSEFMATAQDGKERSQEGLALRPACQMCDQPIPEHTSIHIHLFGTDLNQGLLVTIEDEIAAKLGFKKATKLGKKVRQKAINQFVKVRSEIREKELATTLAQMASDGGFAEQFTTCIRCHNCMTVCPLCYCQICLFKSTSFDHKPDYYLNAARRKGALRMLGDTSLFHITRMNHLNASCVSCGMCTAACPSDIPVGTIFSAVGSQVQQLFDYLPGRDVDEPLPLITFREQEWSEVGEEK